MSAVGVERAWLPAVTRANLLRCLVVGYLIFCMLYLGSAALARAPLQLELTALDRAVPFVPASILVYLSQFVLLPFALLKARDDDSRSHTFYAMLLATLLAAVFFALFPTTVPRPVPPADGVLGTLWAGLHLADTPNNGLPSLHVALSALSGAVLWQAKRPLLATVWPGLIIVSTLTTRQHVAWDVAGGLLLAIVAWSLTPKLVPYERTHPLDCSASR